MSATTAKIRAKGCETTGLNEDLARKLFDAGAGKYLMAVIELEVVQPHGPDVEGKRSVDLVITQVEPATDTKLDEHLRDLTRALHANRKLHDENEQPTLDTGDDIEPTVAGVMAAGAAQVLTCSGCLHKYDHDGITHEPDDGCTWACGHLVHADDSHCTKRECEPQEAMAGAGADA